MTNLFKKHAPVQVLVIPFKKSPLVFCIFRRKDDKNWQCIAGGAYVDELPLEAAKREFKEETGIEEYKRFMQLESVCSIPTENVAILDYWENTSGVTEFSFAVELFDKDEPSIRIEHIDYKRCSYEEAMSPLKWDSNRNALTELYRKIGKKVIRIMVILSRYNKIMKSE